jgi:hypothetical protein
VALGIPKILMLKKLESALGPILTEIFKKGCGNFN